MENPFVIERKRNKEILARIWREHLDLDEEKIIAIFSAKTGISEKTTRQYLKEIKALYEGVEEIKKEQQTLN